jgi:hypothetical protein
MRINAERALMHKNIPISTVHNTQKPNKNFAAVQEMSNDTEAMVGSEMLLDCAVTGNPPAEVLWLTPRFVFLF